MKKKSVTQQGKQILRFLFLFTSIGFNKPLFGQVKPGIAIISLSQEVAPLDKVYLVCTAKGTISVSDAKGNIYKKLPSASSVSFVAGGAAGVQKVILTNAQGAIVATAQFNLKVVTNIDDRGKFSSLFTILKTGMISENRKAYFEFKRNGSSYKCYVPWDLDNSNVMNGNQYFLPHGNGLTDLLKATQRKDGMIWSFVAHNSPEANPDYFETAYKSIGFFEKEKITNFNSPKQRRSHP